MFTPSSSTRPIRRSLHSDLSRCTPVSSSSSSQPSTSTPLSEGAGGKRRDSLDSIYSACSSIRSEDSVRSPPTRWPSSRTPRRRRPPLLDDSSISLDTTVSSSSSLDQSTTGADESATVPPNLEDSGFHEDIFASPPINKSSLSQTSLLRTPSNAVLRQRASNSSFLASTNSPSPLRSFKIREVSHLSSNGVRSGSTQMRFSGADVSQSQLIHIGKTETAKLKVKEQRRHLSPPPPADREVKMETPSKGYEEDEDEVLFSIASASLRMRDVPEMTSGPIESSLFPMMGPLFSVEEEDDEEEDTCDGFEEESDEEEITPTVAPTVRPSILQQSQAAGRGRRAVGRGGAAAAARPPLGDLQLNSLKRRTEDGWKRGQEAKRSRVGEQPSRTVVDGIKAEMLDSVQEVKDTTGKLKYAFRAPKKPFKTYSKRWWQMCCGTTVEQRSLGAQAHAFLRAFGVAPTGAPAPSKKPPVASIKREVVDFDSDVNFASYLGGLDMSYATPEDPLNYQPPPLVRHY